jgi:hypothetical protein
MWLSERNVNGQLMAIISAKAASAALANINCAASNNGENNVAAAIVSVMANEIDNVMWQPAYGK